MGGSPEAAFPGSDMNRLGPWATYDPTMPVEARIASIAAVAGTATNFGGGKSANGALSGSYWRLYSAAATVHTYKVGPNPYVLHRSTGMHTSERIGSDPSSVCTVYQQSSRGLHGDRSQQ